MTVPLAAVRNINEDTITQAVIARHAEAPEARLRELMTCLVQHLHAFARETRLTEAEWLDGIRFLIDTGRLCSDQRQEFMLLSDTLGLSMLVTAMNQRKPAGCTESSACAAPQAQGAPQFAQGADIAQGAPGEPCFVRGRVVALDGTPVADAEIAVHQADAESLPETANAGLPPCPTRGVLRSGADGGFHFRSILPGPHPIPDDGPVGRMLKALGRHAWRPAHLQFTINAPGCRRLVTHVFRQGDKYLDSDALFGVRHSLVADWVRHDPGRTPDGGTSALPFHTLDFEFVLDKVCMTPTPTARVQVSPAKAAPPR